MIGPLLIVPVAAIWNIIEAFRRKQPIKDVFSTQKWRHKEESKQPRHKDEGRSSQLYSYIDPLSRGTSTKSNRNISGFSFSSRKDHAERYARVTEQLRHWTNQTSKCISESKFIFISDRPKLRKENYDDYDEENDVLSIKNEDWREAQHYKAETSTITHFIENKERTKSNSSDLFFQFVWSFPSVLTNLLKVATICLTNMCGKKANNDIYRNKTKCAKYLSKKTNYYWDIGNQYVWLLRNRVLAFYMKKNELAGFDSSQPNNKAILPLSASSDLITFTLTTGSLITLRASGAEPKIKYYIELKNEPGKTENDLEQIEAELIN
ncbi:E3_UbLigase_EDD domain-containing protein [Meloidogyne graminicola]|uniref:E3_UbLigase_EDD domain-containing protein n=1 Tax=Meloidogyne graminicola TaxID=189291 RepID=A0A8S9ZEP2_9BILA|nr:E3_UbLigase_EDD domain-containing protein [Meloidogyne graminicola]